MNNNTLDPQLLKIINKIKENERNSVLESRENQNEELVSVTAKVRDAELFFTLPGVYEGENITLAPDKKGHIVTAKVSITEIENINKSPVVLSLKGARQLKPLLIDTKREINAPTPPFVNGELGGAGVVIGIIDHGCDFVHTNFRNRHGETRLLYLWNQPKEKVYSKEDINNVIFSDNPYEELGYSIDAASHGTHVMDIAAGDGGISDVTISSGVAGLAPRADIIFVEAAYWDYEERKSNFGDSRDLLRAIKFIFDQAGDQPCIVNISLGTNGGPHDGTTHVEQGIDGLVIERPNRAVVIAAGNAYEDNIHATGLVSEGEYVELYWKNESDDPTENELELWYDGADELRLEIFSPEGERIGGLELGGEPINKTNIFATHILDNSNNNNQIDITIVPSQNSEIWKILLHGIKVNNGKFHAWIERDNFMPDAINYGQSSFATSNDNTHTLGSICCGQYSIVVGSYDAKSIGTPISEFSSAGPTRDGKYKPEISAPGHNVAAAASLSDNSVIMSGTSMAAPAVTGVIALMLAEAKAHNLSLSIEQIRNILKETARHTLENQTGWDNRYGYGRIDAKAAIERVKSIVEENRTRNLPHFR
ncbi:S8 family peptidase [Bacillus thuringiensis]|uniref:S8 family peptidase n=1 Tax=Bacillus thuringiensis TaxID=1428 RepID=UPI000D56FF77|nr:S8 family peptidase [Bacillus thuringiensis]MBD8076944.1 S8 family peptidase [Bacillus thuringiensis]